MKQRILSSPEWRSFITEQDYRRSLELGRELAGALTENEFLQLAEALQDVSVREAVLNLLLQVPKQQAPLMGNSQELMQAIGAILTSEYPESNLGMKALHILHSIAPGRAKAFLLNLDILSLNDEKHLRRVIWDIVSFDLMELVPTLRELEKRGGAVGEFAKKTREGMGAVDDHALFEMAADWRRTKDGNLLSRLYHIFIRFQMEKPIQPLLDMLGEPTGRRTDHLWYDASDGSTMYLEHDSAGRLVGAKISGG
jgi:hypothetical protein